MHANGARGAVTVGAVDAGASRAVDTVPGDAVDAIVRGDHGDPFAVLGMHEIGGGIAIRAFLPQASRVEAIDAETGEPVAELARIREAGFFSAIVPARKTPFAYRLRVTVGNAVGEIADPYAFGPVLGEVDVYLLGEGRHLKLYEKFGAHLTTMDGVAGASFVVWAPNAKRVSVVGDFNDWDGRRYPMRKRAEAGVWEIFLPGIAAGALYKYELLDTWGNLLPLKADPFAFSMQGSPGTASIVAKPGSSAWHDTAGSNGVRRQTNGTRRCRSTKSISARGSARTGTAISPIVRSPTS